MKVILFALTILFMELFSFTTFAQNEPKILSILSSLSRAETETRYLEFFKNEFKGCSLCEIHFVTVYQESGEVDWQKTRIELEKLALKRSVLLLTWNEKVNAENQKLVLVLKLLAEKGLIIIGPSDVPKENLPSAALSRTVLGQVSKALIIAELNEKESLVERGFYGPEILTALRPSKESLTQGFSAAGFAARLILDFDKRPNQDWIDFLKNRKLQSKRIWPNLDEMFRGALK